MKTHIKAAEGIFINLPNGKEALRLISYLDAEVEVTNTENKVRVVLEFKDPFIHPTDKRPKAVQREERQYGIPKRADGTYYPASHGGMPLRDDGTLDHFSL